MNLARRKMAALGCLFLKSDWGSADSLYLKAHVHFDTVGDPYKRNSAVHTVVLAVKCHRSHDCAGTCALTGYGECQLFLSSHSANRKVAIHREGIGTGLLNLRGLECDIRILLDVEEILALLLSVLHSASRVHTVRLNLNVQDTRREIPRRERQRGIPLIERPIDGHRSVHLELNLTFDRRNLESRNTDGNLRGSCG